MLATQSHVVNTLGRNCDRGLTQRARGQRRAAVPLRALASLTSQESAASNIRAMQRRDVIVGGFLASLALLPSEVRRRPDRLRGVQRGRVIGQSVPCIGLAIIA